MLAENIITQNVAITLDLRPIDLTVKNDDCHNTAEILFIKHGTYKEGQIYNDPSKTLLVPPQKTITIPKESFFGWSAFVKIEGRIEPLSNPPLF